MRDYRGVPFASLPEPSADDFLPRLRSILGTIDYWARDASAGFARITQGQSPVASGVTIPIDPTSGVLANYLYKPGLLGGQTGTQSDPLFPFLTIAANSSATSVAGAALKFAIPVASGSVGSTNSLLYAATTDGVAAVNLKSDGSLVLSAPYTTYSSGNPIMLSLEMADNTTFGSTFFRIRTVGSDVFAVAFNGTTAITPNADNLGLSVKRFGLASVSDLQRWLDHTGTTIAAVTKDGNYQLVAGGALGSVFTSDASGIGSWVAPSAMTVSYADNLFSIFDGAASTHIAQFKADGLPVGTSVFNFPPLAAAGTDTLAALGLAQTFSAAQSFTPLTDVVPITGTIPAWGGVSPTVAGLAVVDTDSGGTIFDVLGLNSLLGAVATRVGKQLFISAADVIGSAGTLLQSNATVQRINAFPNVPGTVLVRAGSADRQAQVALIGATSLVASGNVAEGIYQINGNLSCVGTGGPTPSGQATVSVTWTDENGSQTRQVGSIGLTAVSASGTNPPQTISTVIRCVTGRVTAASLVSGGAGYAVDDLLQITTAGSGCILKVTAVAAGVITGFTLQGGGRGYTAGTPRASARIAPLPLVANTSATFNITAVSAAAAIQYSVAYLAGGNGVYSLNLRANAA